MQKLVIHFVRAGALASGVLLLISCGPKVKSTEEGKLTDSTYVSQEVGWTITIPKKGWDVSSLADLQAQDDNGAKLMNKSGQNADFTGLKHLIAFKKGALNQFSATSQPYSVEKNGPWSANFANVKILLYNTFSKQGIRADTTATSEETIDGKKFLKYDVDLFNPQGTKVMTETVYGRFVAGKDFGVLVAFNNEKDEALMLGALRSSIFEN